jgi:hypothetical protein
MMQSQFGDMQFKLWFAYKDRFSRGTVALHAKHTARLPCLFMICLLHQTPRNQRQGVLSRSVTGCCVAAAKQAGAALATPYIYFLLSQDTLSRAGPLENSPRSSECPADGASSCLLATHGHHDQHRHGVQVIRLHESQELPCMACHSAQRRHESAGSRGLRHGVVCYNMITYRQSLNPALLATCWEECC